jgi:hypothetical protein
LAQAATATPTIPGPSQGLWDEHPGYRCGITYYVSPAGSDAASGTSKATAWATLQHANDILAQAGSAPGTCIIAAPGTYPHGVLIDVGGNAATPTGYLAYRCAVMDQCIVTDVAAGGANGSFAWNTSRQPMTGSYVFIDGFVLRAASKTIFGQGVQLWDGNDTVPDAPFSVHHIWITNSIISGYGQAGINMNDGEYFFAIHNTVYGNANAGCSAQGSGIAFVVLKAAPAYVRTLTDADNPVAGRIGAFNNAIMWNVVYNNATTACGTASDPYDTDGNDIILDTLNNAGGIGPVYPGSVLVAFNITYNAGGRGIHIFRSENVTVANNSCYNSDLDPYDNGAYRPCIGDNIGYSNVFLNNIAYAIPNPALGVPDCGGSGQGCLGFNAAYTGGLVAGQTPDTWLNNISYCTANTQPWGWGCNPMFNGDVFPITGTNANQVQINPQWVNVGATAQGTETTQPLAANFALATGSPAIGTGLLETYLNAQSVDMGACAHPLTQCPPAAAAPNFGRARRHRILRASR